MPHRDRRLRVLMDLRLVGGALAAVMGVVVASSGVSAQLAGFGGGAVGRADMLFLSGEPRQAYELLEEHLAEDSTDYEALWRAARAAVVVGIDLEGSRVQNAWLDPAIKYAQRAVELRPDGIDGLYWRGVSSGRRAMNAAPSYAVDLALVTYDDAHAILAADSLHGGAHNMLGKLDYEIMSLSRIKRTIARTFMGNRALSDASWEDAELHLRRAVESSPEVVLFHFDLAQLYRKRGHREDAIAEFTRTLDLPAINPIDHKLQRQAREILEEWGAQPDSLASPAVPSAADSTVDSTERGGAGAVARGGR